MRISLNNYTAKLVADVLAAAARSDLPENDRKRLYLVSCKISERLTLPAPDKGDSPAPQNLSTLEGDSTAEHEPTPAPCG